MPRITRHTLAVHTPADIALDSVAPSIIPTPPDDPPADTTEDDATPVVYCYYCNGEYPADHPDLHNLTVTRRGAARNRVCDRLVCDSCRSEHLVSCEHCEERTVDANARPFGGLYLCTACEDYYSICSRCERAYRTELGPDCDCEEESEDETTLDDYGAKLGQLAYDVGRKSFNSSEAWRSKRLFIGLELEMETPDKVTEAALACRSAYPGMCLCKHDGSLTEDGLEFVTAPFTPALWREERPNLTAMLARLRKMGCRSYDTTTCGLHLHLSRASFRGTAHLYKFLALVYHNPKFIFNLSRRATMEAMTEWAGFSDCSIPNLPEKVKHGHDFQRYAAVNLQNTMTVELRFFRGTLNPGSVYRAVQFAEALWEYSRDVSVELAGYLSNFREFLKTHASRYPELAEFVLGISRPTRHNSRACVQVADSNDANANGEY